MTTSNLLGLSLLFLLTTGAASAETCVFSKEFVPFERLSRDPAIEIQRWNAASDEIKGVLKSGNLFSIKYWSCSHFGTQALLYIDPQADVASDELNASIDELAALALAASEAEQVNELLRKRKIKLADLPLQMELDSTAFDEFYVAASIVNNVIVIEIKLAGS